MERMNNHDQNRDQNRDQRLMANNNTVPDFMNPNAADNYQNLAPVNPNAADNYQNLAPMNPNAADNYQNLAPMNPNAADNYQNLAPMNPNAADNYQNHAPMNPNAADNYQNHAPMNNNVHRGFNQLDFDNFSIESEFNRLNLSAPPQSPADLGMQPQSSAYLGMQPQSSAYLGMQPQSSAYLGMQPQSSAYFGMQPQSSAYFGMQPQSSAYFGMQPQSSAYSGMPPQSSSYSGMPPQSSSYSGMPPQSSSYSGMPPQSPAYSGMPPQSPAYSRMPPLPVGTGYGYNPRNLLNGIDLSYTTPPMSVAEIRRLRAEYAARMYPQQGLNMYSANGNNGGAYSDSQNYLNGYRFNNTIRRPRISDNHLNRNMINNQYPHVIGLNNYGPRNRLNLTSLEDMRGRIFLLAKDQQGCRILQRKFEQGSPQEINMIFTEIKDHICELMMHQFGNYLVQKMFECCNEEQLNQLLLLVINDEMNLESICHDMHGTRAMQHLIEQLITQEQRALVISALRRILVSLIKNQNGHHVVQHCMKLFSTDETRHIMNVITDNCVEISMDQNGCCVIQQCVGNAEGISQQRLMNEITSNALVLSETNYGNYVVQYVIGLDIPRATSDILAQLRGHYVSLSMNKYGSNVVEKFIKETEGGHVQQIIEEIVMSQKLLMIFLDPYGNYVAQSALSKSKGELRHEIVRNIRLCYARMHSHPHGKRVLEHARNLKLHI